MPSQLASQPDQGNCNSKALPLRLIALKRRLRTATLLFLRPSWHIFDLPRWVAGHNGVLRHILSISASTSQICTQTALTLVTTLAAPTTLPLPTFTPGRIVTLPPIQQSSPISISAPPSGPCVPFLTSGSRGCVPLNRLTFDASRDLAPILTAQVSRMVALKLMNTFSPMKRLVP